MAVIAICNSTAATPIVIARFSSLLNLREPNQSSSKAIKSSRLDCRLRSKHFSRSLGPFAVGLFSRSKNTASASCFKTKKSKTLNDNKFEATFRGFQVNCDLVLLVNKVLVNFQNEYSLVCVFAVFRCPYCWWFNVALIRGCYHCRPCFQEHPISYFDGI